MTGIALTSTPQFAAYHRGKDVEATVTFDAAVDITGSPQLELVSAGTAKAAACAAATNTTTMVCSYTVGADDSAPNGIAIGANKLTGGTIEAFAELWLMPRLAAFRRAHPEIVIEFETDHYEVDPARRAFDVWIAFVAGVPRTVQSEVLFEETLVPVCSPGWLASKGRPAHPADLPALLVAQRNRGRTMHQDLASRAEAMNA